MIFMKKQSSTPPIQAVYSRLIVVPPFTPSPRTDRFPADFALHCFSEEDGFQEELEAFCQRYQQVFVHAPFLESVARPLPDNCFPLFDIALADEDASLPLKLAVADSGSLRQLLQEVQADRTSAIHVVSAHRTEHIAQAVHLLPGPSALNVIRPKYFSLTGEFDLVRKETPFAGEPPRRLVACLGIYSEPYGSESFIEPGDWVKLVQEAAASAGWEVIIVTAPGWPNYPEARQDVETLDVLAEALAQARILITACPRAAHVAVALGRSAVIVPLYLYLDPLFRDADALCAIPVAHDPTKLAALLREVEVGTVFPADRKRYATSHGGQSDPRQRILRLLDALGKARGRTLSDLPPMPSHRPIASQPPLSVFVFGANPQGMYSGGRYHAWILAESLALVGHDVTFVTNVEPLFSRDFALSPTHHRLKVLLCPTFQIRKLRCAVDCVIIVPSMYGSHYFYENALSFAKQFKAHACLLNFESPNWFNAFSPVPRDPMGWADWARIAPDCSMIISALNVNSAYAKQYYDLFDADCRHAVAPPPLNDLAADIVSVAKREDRIVAIIRFDLAEHKGGSRLIELIDASMRGYTLALLVGQEKRPKVFLRQLEAQAEACGVTLEFLDRLSDLDKFKEISRAKLLLFMSQFEGYGYPPLEALYCCTPCLAFDLEPLRESCGDLLHYAPFGDWDAFKAQLAELLAAPFDNSRETAFDADSLRMATFGDSLGQMLHEMCAIPPSSAIWRHCIPSYKIFCADYAHRLLAGDRPKPLLANQLTVMDASLHDGCVLSLAAVVGLAGASVRVAVNGVEVSHHEPGALSADIKGEALLVRRILPPQALAKPPETCTITVRDADGEDFETSIHLRAGGQHSPAALFIETQQFDTRLDRLWLTGWALGASPGFCLRISQQNRELGYAELNLPRPDIAGRYGLGQRRYGWRFEGDIRTQDSIAASVAVEMLDGDRLLARRVVRIEYPDKAVLEWTGTSGQQSPHEGPVAAVITHVPFMPVRQGNHVVIAQLLSWLRAQGYLVFLVMQIPPRFLLEHQAAYQAVADRIFIVNPEIQTPGTVPLNNADLTHITTKHCLHDIASRHDLRLAVAEYVHLASALNDLPSSVLTLVQTHDVLHRLQQFKARGLVIDQPFRNCTAQAEKSLLRCAQVVIAIQDHERSLFSALVPDLPVITVGVSRDCFGEPLPPSPEHSRSVFIAASNNPFNVEGLEKFIEHCWPAVRSQVPDARLRLAGKISQTEKFNVPGVECLGLIDNLDAEYRNAAVCINPVTMGTGLKIKSVETLARGRALVSTSVGVEGISAHGHRAFVVTDDWRLFAQAVAIALQNVAYRREMECEATTYARLYLNRDFVYCQLSEILKRHRLTSTRHSSTSSLLQIV